MTAIHLDRAKAAAMARNLSGHLKAAHALKLSYAQARVAVAKTLGYNEVQVMDRDLKTAAADAAPSSVTFVKIEHRRGETTRAFAGSEDAGAWVVRWCLTYWEAEDLHRFDGLEDPTRLSDDEIVDAYFGAVDGEYLSLETIDLADLDSLHDDVEFTWQELDAAGRDARTRGWGLHGGRIRAVGNRFADDDAARAYVARMADRGEPLARTALKVADEPAPRTPARYLVTMPGQHFRLDLPGDEAYVAFAYDRERGEVAAISSGFEHLKDALARRLSALSEDHLTRSYAVRDEIPEPLRAPRRVGRYVYSHPAPIAAWRMPGPHGVPAEVAWMYDRQERRLVAWQVDGVAPDTVDHDLWGRSIEQRLEGPLRAYLDDPDLIGNGWVMAVDDLEAAQLFPND